MTKHFITALLLLGCSALGASAAQAGVDDLSVQAVSQTRVLERGRTAYYSYEVTITNAGVALTNVRATVSSTSRAVRVTERSLSFPDIGADGTVTSDDSFSIRVRAGRPPDLSVLRYTFTADIAAPADITPPTITARLSTPPNAAGWHNAPVTVSFDCSDDTGIASCSADVLISDDGAGQVVTGVAQDLAGNTANTSVTINLDTVAPPLSGSLAAGFDTPPTDQQTLLQQVALSTTTDPGQAVEFLLEQGNALIPLGVVNVDAAGAGVLGNVSLASGSNRVLLRTADIADNVTEVWLTLERLQCAAQPQNEPFYLGVDVVPGAPNAALQPDSALFAGTYVQFQAQAQGLLSVLPGLINGDLLSDWVVLDRSQNGVVVYVNDGSDTVPVGQTLLTGNGLPVAGALRELVEGPALDLAVGHVDGTVNVFAGLGDGQFDTAPVLTFSHAEPVVDLIAKDLDGDNDVDLAVLTTTQLHIYVRQSAEAPVAVINNGDFSRGLAGWQVSAVGQPINALPGTVSVAGAGARLLENDSFLVSLSQTFRPGDDEDTLSFELLQIDLDEPLQGIPDAVEVSLLDNSSGSLVPTINTQATSFLNIGADGSVRMAPGVSFSGGRAELDVAGVTGEATLIIDLIGNPPGRGSSVVVANVDAGVSMPVNNTYESAIADSDIDTAGGMAFCDAVDGSAPLLVADPGGNRVLVLRRNVNGEFERSAVLSQGE